MVMKATREKRADVERDLRWLSNPACTLAKAYGKRCGEWIWGRLRGKSWGVVPEKEVGQWLVGEITS
jgi:hypothetical protein